MSISTVGFSSPFDPTVMPPTGKPVQDLKALQSALKSGSISDAQSAFASFQNDLATGATKMEMAINSSSPDSAVSQNMASLQSALESNDLSSAQQSFMSLKQDFRMMKQQMHMQQGGNGTSASGDPAVDPSTAASGNTLDTTA